MAASGWFVYSYGRNKRGHYRWPMEWRGQSAAGNMGSEITWLAGQYNGLGSVKG